MWERSDKQGIYCRTVKAVIVASPRDRQRRTNTSRCARLSLSLGVISQLAHLSWYYALLDECTSMGFLCSCSGRTTSKVRFLFRSVLLSSASYSRHVIVRAVRCCFFFFFPSLLSLFSFFFFFLGKSHADLNHAEQTSPIIYACSYSLFFSMPIHCLAWRMRAGESVCSAGIRE